MKQFIVDRHTTPNTPTLEQVPTEKIPVYEDMAAAAADLANLEVGQIVATHDTGSELSAPVDTVQSGNMHAVTSNAVYNAMAKFSSVQGSGMGSPVWQVLEVGNKCICFGFNTEPITVTAGGYAYMVLPNTLQLDKLVSADIFLDGNSTFARGGFHESGNGCVIYSSQAGTIGANGCRVIVLADKV